MLKALFLTVMVFVGAALGVGRWALSYQAPCSQPCKDVRTGQPINLSLRLLEPRTRVGKRYTLWYQVALTNQSCWSLHVINATSFIWSLDRLHGLLEPSIEVRGPDGSLVNEIGHPGAATQFGSPKSEYGDVIPYSDDPASFRRFKADLGLKMDDDGFVTLQPGRTLTSASPILDPHVDTIGDMSGPGWKGSGVMSRKVELAGAPTPPPGFRILDRYVFRRPGRYTMRVVYDNPDVLAKPIYPYADRVPATLKSFMRTLGIVHGLDASPALRDEVSGLHVHAESEAVEFEVLP